MKNRNAIHKSAEDHVINLIALVVCVLVTLISLYPIYYCLINSLNDGKDAMKGGIYLWPRIFSLKRCFRKIRYCVRS